MHSASSLHAAADALSAKCAKDRLARWKLAVQDDIPRLASWIKRDPPASPAGPPLSDAAQAEFWASEWESRWKAGFTDLAALDRLSSCLPQLPTADLPCSAIRAIYLCPKAVWHTFLGFVTLSCFTANYKNIRVFLGFDGVGFVC